MNSKPHKQITPEERVNERLVAALNEVNGQLLRAEIEDVRVRANISSRNTVVSYLEGNAPKPDTAATIIKAAREIILERERKLSKVA